MLRKRKTKKATKQQVQSFRKGMTSKYLTCKVCDTEEVNVSADCVSVTCSHCVQRMVAPPVLHSRIPKSDKPRGWHFKAFFEQDGVVYAKGEEITDVKEIARLRKLHGNDTTMPKKAKVKAVSKPRKSKVQKRGKKNARTTK